MKEMVAQMMKEHVGLPSFEQRYVIAGLSADKAKEADDIISALCRSSHLYSSYERISSWFLYVAAAGYCSRQDIMYLFSIGINPFRNLEEYFKQLPSEASLIERVENCEVTVDVALYHILQKELERWKQ
jgi:hypothetical protein